MDFTPLPQLAAKLIELTGEPGPGYTYIRRQIIAGRVPAVFEFGRYFIRNEDLPRIAALLGLLLKNRARRDHTPAIERPRPPGPTRGGRPRSAQPAAA
jgi:hypothetical protein